jgi:hypothetical protein
MKRPSSRSHEAENESAIDKLMIAHNEIIEAWFEHWSSQEKSRIDLAFEKSRATVSDVGHDG